MLNIDGKAIYDCGNGEKLLKKRNIVPKHKNINY